MRAVSEQHDLRSVNEIWLKSLVFVWITKAWDTTALGGLINGLNGERKKKPKTQTVHVMLQFWPLCVNWLQFQNTQCEHIVLGDLGWKEMLRLCYFVPWCAWHATKVIDLFYFIGNVDRVGAQDCAMKSQGETCTL